MKFNFSFQKVLDFKEKEKEIAEQEYGMAKIQQQELEEQLGNLENEKNQFFAHYDHVHQKSILEILDAQTGIDYLNHQIKQLESKSHQIQQEVDQKYDVLIEKTQESKMWNQWKEKSKDIFQKQLLQKEQAMLDEMAVIRYFRK
ncbi:flagellar export protein FliJ [Pseudoneobacillus sp. C159]